MPTIVNPKDAIYSLGLQDRILLEANEHEAWGAYYRFDDTETEEFVDRFYPEIADETWISHILLRPSIVVIEPNKEMPIHSHSERAEMVKVLGGSAIVNLVSRCGFEDRRGIGEGNLITIEPGVRHGFEADTEGLVLAELWGRKGPNSTPGSWDVL